jgi:hypothetical protein
VAGYFEKDDISIRLGDHAFATPAVSRRNVVLEPHAAPAAVLDAGGGMTELAVTMQAARANLGDAERWIYELLTALARAEPGLLVVEDSRRQQAAFDESVCISAGGRVRAFTFADVQMDWLAPEKSAEPAPAGGVPAAPGTYGGTSTALDYAAATAAGSVAIGTHPEGMRIEMARRYPLREVPRARGARSRGPEEGAHVRFTVVSHAVAGAGEHLADYLADLAREIGACPVDLTGNGNTFAGVVLESLRPSHTDRRHTRFEAAFLMELAPVGLTTTPAPYPTTTPALTTTPAPTTSTTTVAPTTTPAPTTTLPCDVFDDFAYT